MPVARAAVSEAMVLLLLIRCLLFLPLYGFCNCSMFCFEVLSALSSFAMDGEEDAGCFTLFVFLVSCVCYCSVALPRGAVGWSALCDCGIS